MPVLEHDSVTAPGATPEEWIYALHGVFGAGRNWGSVMRHLVRERPDWGAVLVDLREHGGSRGFPGPHTLLAAARDVRELVEAVTHPSRALLGHSFGGKVALLYAREYAVAAGLRQLWLVDSTPAPTEPGGSAWEMLALLRRHPGPFESRGDAVRALEADGVETGVAQWVSTNLAAGDGGYRWQLDLDAIEELLRDFFRADLWDVVENPPPGLELHVVKAEGSPLLGEAACAHIEAAARTTGRVFLHRVAGGHWLNADNPAALEALLARTL